MSLIIVIHEISKNATESTKYKTKLLKSILYVININCILISKYLEIVKCKKNK